MRVSELVQTGTLKLSVQITSYTWTY